MECAELSSCCCDRPKHSSRWCASGDRMGGADRNVRLIRVACAIGRCVSTRKATRRCEFSPSGTVLSPVEPGILRMSSTRGRRLAPHLGDRSEANGFRAKRKPKEARGGRPTRSGRRPGRLDPRNCFTESTAVSAGRSAALALGKSPLTCVRARFRARDGPLFESR